MGSEGGFCTSIWTETKQKIENVGHYHMIYSNKCLFHCPKGNIFTYICRKYKWVAYRVFQEYFSDSHWNHTSNIPSQEDFRYVNEIWNFQVMRLA